MAGEEQKSGSGAAGSNELEGPAKAALLLISLDREVSSKILKNLDQDSIEVITKEIARTQSVDPKQRRAVVTEFYNLALIDHVEEPALGKAKLAEGAESA